MIFAAPVDAQPSDPLTPPETAAAAVDRANNAFEYRDFERVVSLLYPWLHPRRILEPSLAIEARRLLGVSLHVVDRVEDAREEFAELLLLDPRHRLDPFLVPPAVIQTFENVRRSMRPTLDEILRERGDEPRAKPTVTGPPIVQRIEVPPLAVAFLPLGIPQFVAEEPGWGLLWAVLQVGSLALNLVAYNQAGREEGGFGLWTGLQYTGLVGLVGSWSASAVQGYIQLESQRDRRLNGPLSAPIDEAASRLPPATPGLNFGWDF